jgi:hypothetical protein
MRFNPLSRGWLLLIVAALLSLSLTGCFASARPRGVYVEASVPVGVAAYPPVYYDGRPYYRAHDRWYYREGPRVYYRQAPPALAHRHVYVDRAPRAYPSRHERERVVVAPRARRVR